MIKATKQIGAGTEITDRAGRTWEYRVYNSPSGPAFWITLPESLCPEGTANYTVHFDGVIAVSQPAAARGSAVECSPGDQERRRDNL